VREELRRGARGHGGALISTELDEVLELSMHAVLFRGRLLPVAPDAHTREAIGRLMLGEGAP
jgi:ABC-type uncharacterized transport system ATPase subunit